MRSLFVCAAVSLSLFALACDSSVPQSCPAGQQVLGGACVACLGDGDCPAGQICNADHDCVTGCDDTRPCPTGKVCDPSTSTCAECAHDGDCPLGRVCTRAMCVAGCNASHGCPSGQQCDTTSGMCVQCVDDSGCSGATPRCDPSSHTCVACLAQNDNCPMGEFCRQGDTCARGCKTNADCASGTCGADHSCAPCTTDGECVAGDVCQSGMCVPACDAQNPCAGSDQCCGGHCVDAMNDVANCGGCGMACAQGQACCGGTCDALDTAAHCGACSTVCGSGSDCCGGSCTSLKTLSNCGSCGNACPSGDFCDGTTCQTPTYPNFCKNPTVYAIYDGHSNDDTSTNLMASTITANCPMGTVVNFANQTDASLVDQTTGEPLGGAGVTYVLGGGPFANVVVKWLELTEKVTKIYFSAPDGINFYWDSRATGQPVAQIAGSQCTVTPATDQFIVELVADPNNGTLSLVGYGACAGGKGTRAAGWYYANQMLPNAASYPDSWYIVSWTDDGDGAPGAGDTYSIVAHGN